MSDLKNIRLALIALSVGALLGTEALAADAPAADAPASAVAAPPVFARVGNAVITWQDYNVALAEASRAKYYHGKPPEAEIALMQREVGNKLVANALLLREAKKRKLQPDAAALRKKLDQHEQRYARDAQWQQARAEVLPLLTRQWREESLLSQLEKRVRNVPPPKEAQLREYYAAHPDKFTEPEQIRASVILLSVDPSSPPEGWQQALDEAQDLVRQLRGGADFAEMAREHSADADTAQRGGDMGYLHGGMLSEAAQQAVDKLKQGETSDPIRTLEGVTILRLMDRKQPVLGSFESVKKRVRELWFKDEGERVWQALIERLKKETPVFVDESQYQPLPAASETGVPKSQ